MNKLGNIPVVSCFNDLWGGLVQPFKDSWKSAKADVAKRLKDAAYSATDALNGVLSKTPVQIRPNALGYRHQNFDASRFIGSPSDPAPISWNRHHRLGGGNPSNDYTAINDSFSSYGGPVTSLYAAINGLRDTVDGFIDITKEEQSYFKTAVSHEAKQILQYFRFLNDPVFRQMHNINPKQYTEILGKMLGEVKKTFDAEQKKLTSVYGGALTDAWNIISQVISEVKTPVSKDASVEKMLSDIARGKRDAWINEPIYHKYTEAESRGVPGGKTSVHARPLSDDEAAGMAFMMAGLGGKGNLDPKKYGKYAGQQKGNGGQSLIEQLGGWEKALAAEKALRATGNAEALRIANLIDAQKKKKQGEQDKKGGKNR